MTLPRFSVRRPVFTTMATLIVIVLGLVSVSRLQMDLLPAVELPIVSVSTSYPGASPEVMEQAVTRLIEEIVATQPGVEEISSESSEGQSRVRIRFGFGTDVDTAALDVQAKIEDEINELPDDIVRPRVSKFDIAGFPVVILGIASDLNPIELTELVEDEVRYRFSRVPGVAQVDVWGGFNREIRVEIDPGRIKALGLPLNEVLSAIRDANLDLPAGEIEQGQFDVTLRAPGEFQSLDQLRDTVISMREGAPVLLGQIAEVRDTYEEIDRHIRINGRQGLRVGIRKQADAYTVDVANGVIEEIEAINRELPQIEVIPVSNQGNFIERSIANVANSVAFGGLLAILVLLFFLRNLRSTLVIALAIPISIVATFALVYFGGLTLNLMTLGGLALGVGMMVDNSIVVLENIYRRRDEEAESPAEAAVNGAAEVGPAIIASTITTLVIFLPLVFVRGVSGVLFQSLGFVVVFALSCSLAVALSLVPMLASKLIKPKRRPRPRWRFDARPSSTRAANWRFSDSASCDCSTRNWTPRVSISSFASSATPPSRIGRLTTSTSASTWPSACAPTWRRPGCNSSRIAWRSSSPATACSPASTSSPRSARPALPIASAARSGKSAAIHTISSPASAFLISSVTTPRAASTAPPSPPGHRPPRQSRTCASSFASTCAWPP